MSTLKTYQQLPVHVVEDHNDALYHILRSIGSKHVPFSNNVMVHFDSHPDLLIPAELDSSDVCEPQILYDKLSIENWILPAAFAGHISTIIWIKPTWSNQIDDGHYKFIIGKHKDTTQIKVNSRLLYFISEMLYCDEKDLEDTKNIDLYVFTLSDSENIDKQINEIINKNGGNYLLDIDLDYFSTMNPFIEMYKDVNMYDKLKSIYKFTIDEDNGECNPSEIENMQLKRIAQISELKIIFNKLTNNTNEDLNIDELCRGILNDDTRKEVHDLITSLKETYKDSIDWELVHDAGCTCDDDRRILPHHISTKEEILKLMNKVDIFLNSLPRPLIVTIARSSLDDYCPPVIVDSLQDQMIKILRKSYNLEEKLHYQQD